MSECNHMNEWVSDRVGVCVCVCESECVYFVLKMSYCCGR